MAFNYYLCKDFHRVVYVPWSSHVPVHALDWGNYLDEIRIMRVLVSQGGDFYYRESIHHLLLTETSSLLKTNHILYKQYMEVLH